MSVTLKHGLYAVQLDDVADVVIGGISAARVDMGNEVQAEPSSGDVYALANHIISQKPSAEFTTFELKVALDAIGVSGLDIATLANGISLWAQKHADAGGRATGANHRKYNAVKGLIVPVGLDFDHRGNAKLRYEVTPTWDGTNDPIIETDSQTPPTGFTNNNKWTLGKVTIGGFVMTEVKSASIEFGLALAPESADSDLHDSFVSIIRVVPRITIRGMNVEWLKAANIPRNGKAGTHANTSFYLRKRLGGGGYELDVTAVHVKFTMDGLAWIDGAYDASDEESGAECSVIMQGKYDGANTPLKVDTASAIT